MTMSVSRLLFALVALLAAGMVTLAVTESVVTALNLMFWAFVVYVLVRLVEACVQIPSFQPYLMKRGKHEEIDYVLATAVRLAGPDGTNEAEAMSFVGQRVAEMRHKVVTRYVPVRARIHALGTHGVIIALFGALCFVVQVMAVLQAPGVLAYSSSFDAYLGKGIPALNELNYWTAGGAFSVSAICLLAKSNLEAFTQLRAADETTSLDEVGVWILKQIPPRLARVMTPVASKAGGR